ncbi:MAG: DNA-deoxyinosine glycosylase [Lachnoclostridium sp.]|nr:DNA-deoxyinosine glycosylase [Lachnoclostridium sp.]
MGSIKHPIPPVYDKNSKILILGSFPSVKSREGCFFYHHPQNRFWKTLAAVLEQPVPESIEEKRTFLLNNHIAVWDTIASCTIEGSSDSSIKNVVPNDLSVILSEAPDLQIFCNGAASHQYYRKYQEKLTGRQALRLPSTSPANAAWSLERLKQEWSIIRNYLY